MEVLVKKGKIDESDLLYIIKFDKSEIDSDLTWCPKLKDFDMLRRIEKMIISSQGKDFPKLPETQKTFSTIIYQN